MLRKRTLRKESKDSQHMTAVSKQEEQGPRYEEVSLKVPQYEEILVQNNHVYHTLRLEPPAWLKDKLQVMLLFSCEILVFRHFVLYKSVSWQLYVN